MLSNEAHRKDYEPDLKDQKIFFTGLEVFLILNSSILNDFSNKGKYTFSVLPFTYK